MAETVPLATFMWTRIHQMGVDSIFGVAGDFNLNFLDHIDYVEGLDWIGNSNELNAAYAADGYARTKRTPGCLVTTHGVGELSALNGIAGSACEHVPVIHVVGQTPMSAQDNHTMIHHSIGFKPDHQLYNKVSKHLRYSAAELASATEPAAEIDRVLRDCVIQKQPVYIFLPIDYTTKPVDKSLLSKPVDIHPAVNKANEDAAVEAILGALYKAESPTLFIDYLANRCGIAQTQALLDKLQLPFYSANMGKGAFNGDDPNYVGVYNGRITMPGISDAIEACDFVISIGWLLVDTNSSYFSRKINSEQRVDIMPDHVQFHTKRYEDVYMAPLLERLASSIDISKVTKPELFKAAPEPSMGNDDSLAITQSWLWQRLGKFVRPGDCVLADTGTATYGFPNVKLPRDVRFIAQSYWMSIGYTCPAAVGVDLALEQLHKQGTTKQRGRTVLFVGDGALMLTIQEIGTMVLKRLPILVIIINNKGYTIERGIHGARQPYNDILDFDYKHLMPLFAASRPAHEVTNRYHCAATKKELEAILAKDDIINPSDTQVLELKLDAFDLPWQLAEALNVRTPGHLKREGFVGGR